ncbi:cobalt ECF transporter T component CbiQ [Methanobrevibacter olleyae]|uniref:Cobalt ABC transporter, permease protein CbiQ n=1 Tax=Methanobrevibacter olleyae TaxID=294671 RepID=A0A126QX12_METOL|nr:cobalt ECF transporter T component CbiQ [Methanobrevibacter olleyae]AMK14703.1 cobalt ABC transporter, permease protein CbiQ [Methanobrevibacter olleyae]SFL41844.1 cobalt/nickel transport system permease protein [Methanobrevibacter olleyae]
MKFDIDYIAHNNKLTEANPYFKLFLTIILLIATLALDNLYFDIFIFILMSIVILAIAKINYKSYLKFLTIPLAFLIITCLFLIFFFGKGDVIYETGIFGIVVTRNSWHYGLYTFFRVIGCLPSLGFLALTTPIAKIFHCLETMKVPKILIEIGLLMYNTIFIFLNEIDTMQKAQETRLGYHSYWSSLRSLGALISTIFLRSLDKSETLQHALDSRGYTGELPVYIPPKKEE